MNVCFFEEKNNMVFCHADDGAFVDPKKLDIDKFIKDLKELKHNIEETGGKEDCIAINFERKDDDSIKLSQTHLMRQIIDEINMYTRIVDKETPESSSETLHRLCRESNFNNRFHCKRMIGELKFLEKETRPDTCRMSMRQIL